LNMPNLRNPATGGFGTPTITLNDEVMDNVRLDWSNPAALPALVAEAVAAHS